MNKSKMTSLQRVLTTLDHKEPDRVPLFLLLTMHGAKELGMGLKEYFLKAENVVEGQVRVQKKYGHDCYFGFFYAPTEIQAWGGEVIHYENGPANSGEPFIKNSNQIKTLEPPVIADGPVLQEVLKTIRILHEKAAGEVPVLGVALSPFSVPVMQMGFETYLELIYNEPELFDRLMAVNEHFCVEWANAQLAAGASAICYFDPVSSPTIIPRELYLKTGFQVASRTISKIKGSTATHMASGRALPIIDDLLQTGTGAVGVSAEEDIGILKQACRDKLSVIGNLNGLEMIHWSREEATSKVKNAINAAAAGGGFILSDNHGEIPYQVPDEVLLAISDAVRTHGYYTQ
ncbi:MAG: uroporphyrinogen decarboxylase family protein [Bacillota bacterium]